MEEVKTTHRISIRYRLAGWACAGFQQRTKKKTNHRVRMVHVWVVLHHLAGSTGLIPAPSTTRLASAAGLSLNTFKTWVRHLHQEGWIDWQAEQIRVLDEQALYGHLGLKWGCAGDQLFYYPFDEITTKQPYYWIFLANIEDNQQRQLYRFIQAVLNDVDVKAWLFRYLAQKGRDTCIIDKDPAAIARIFKTLYLTGFADGSAPFQDFLRKHRPDSNRSVRGMGRAWASSASTVSYIKAMFVKQSLAHVQKQGTIESPVRSHNAESHVRYNHKKKTTFQALCDDIVILKPCGIKFSLDEPRPP